MIDKLKIGAVTYKVRELDDLHRVNGEGQKQWLHGHYLTADAELRVANDQAHDVKVVTVWHEALHGILTHAGQSDQPEPLMEALSYGIVELLRNNPQLIEYTVKPCDS